MSKGLSYHYSGTKGHIIEVAASLPKKGAQLLKHGWEEISHSMQALHGHHTYREVATGLRIRYDMAKPGQPGFEGKDHYHIYNPNATGARDRYLDKYGNPVGRNSKESHIMPKEKN